ncbi:UDP-glucose 4-epimerase GalE [Magnetospirillum molischianum]|uniref:UDP-glucose 4-epimerase n=1 Tax=Magnetospirillum molischianum DSM 120 TaxID=1150626 RepID=H8FXH3_MAGML|nr:UDP-glucose 4-epimerase GalE [Magnetospirillum molischianum]CCG43061.1 UDP-glucose 4-epimerase (UDP-galactose 4-epimerase) (Galactowaldenase) [Magnetospirillum molischianum DSM 120]
MSNPTVLVTGGAGYVGSHACKALSGAGFAPVCIDNLSRGHAQAVRWGPLIQGDLRDSALLRHTIAAYRPIAVMHFAAMAYPAESMSRPDLYYDNNVTGTLSLLQAMHETGIGIMVSSSSCAVYGTPARLPVTEDAPTAPISPYGSSKLMMEQMKAEFSRAFGLSYFALRYFNAAGADPAGELGEDHDPEPHLLPNALAVAAGHRHFLDVHGDDYPTADGTCVRDFLHVSDLASAHVVALRVLLGGGTGGTLNLGTGQGHSVRELAAQVAINTGRPVPLRIGPRRVGDPPALIADASRASRLGIAYPHSAIESIIATAWAWMSAKDREALPPKTAVQG